MATSAAPAATGTLTPGLAAAGLLFRRILGAPEDRRPHALEPSVTAGARRRRRGCRSGRGHSANGRFLDFGALAVVDEFRQRGRSFRELIARLLVDVMGVIIVANPFHLVGARRHIGDRYEDDLDRAALLYLMDVLAFLVEQKGRDVEGQPGEDLARLVLHRLFLDHTQDRQRQ